MLLPSKLGSELFGGRGWFSVVRVLHSYLIMVDEEDGLYVILMRVDKRELVCTCCIVNCSIIMSNYDWLVEVIRWNIFSTVVTMEALRDGRTTGGLSIVKKEGDESGLGAMFQDENDESTKMIGLVSRLNSKKQKTWERDSLVQFSEYLIWPLEVQFI